MKAPRTRLTEGETQFERELLESWRSEGPSKAARQKTLLVGVGLAAGAVATTTSSGAAKVAAGTGATVPKAASLGALAVGKWVAAGTILAVAASGAAVRYKELPMRTPGAVAHAPATSMPHRSAVTAPALAVTTSEPSVPLGPPSAVPPAPVLEEHAPRPAPLQRPSPSRVESSAVSHVTPPAQPRSVPAPTTLGLGDQVAAVGRAGDALAAGDPARALYWVEQYEAQFPKGALAQEAMALRIEALVKQGNVDTAQRLARELLDAHPNSPHATRIRHLLRLEQKD